MGLKFAELHAHSEFSNLRMIDCNIKVEDLIQGAYDSGLSGIALTDHEALGGHLRAIEKGLEINKLNKDNKEFKVMLGNEIYLCENRDNHSKYYHFILIAKDDLGYQQLKQLSTRAWMNSYRDRGERTVTTYEDMVEVIGEDKGHLIASTACIGGFLGMNIMDYVQTQDEQYRVKIDRFLDYCINLFGDDFYIELQAGKNQEQITLNVTALRIAQSYGIKYIITNDVHYLIESEKELHSAYLKSRDSERETEAFYNSTFMKTPDQLLSWMTELEEMDIIKGINNTMDVYSKCEYINLFKDIEVPTMDLPEFELQHLFSDYYDEYEYIKKMAFSESIEDRYLLLGIEEGFIRKKQQFDSTNLSRIDVECEQLIKISDNLGTRMSSYYTLVDKIVDIIWQVSYVGVARGSVTGFYVCYLLDISQLNPIEHDLPWWRHIHHSKIALADIDLDSEASKRQEIFVLLKDHFGWERCLNIATFKTEGSKSSILTACRGLGVHHDIAQELADYVKIERGAQWSLSDCWYGNEEKDRKPITDFLNKVEEVPNLKETSLKIEGIVCGRSIHASGFYIFNDNFIKYNSAMKAPSGQLTTAWNMDDSDKMGGLKVDILTIEALDKEHIALDFIIEGGVVEDKGSIRANYEAYLHPDVIEYKDPEMWDKLGSGKIISVFQFDTDIGSQGIKKLKPRTLKELAVANSVMRLMATDDGEPPIDKCLRYKTYPKQIIETMDKYGLTKAEQEVINKYLSKNNGMAVEQEDVMEIVLDPKITNFSMKQADTLRKIIAKKKTKDIEKMKLEYFQIGKANGTSNNLLDYIWNECIGIQLGYSFSRNHTTPYSAIAIQEMNIFHKYNHLYWNTAVLTVNASAVDSDGGNNSNTDYGKIANAIGYMQSSGIKIDYPNINSSNMGFYPNIESDSILFGLKGINGIGDDVVLDIIKNRPYSSLIDFNERASTPKVGTINLIKSGAFDKLENKPRVEIMKDYLVSITKAVKSSSLTFANLPKLLEYDLIPERLFEQISIRSFYKMITNKKYKFDKVKNRNRNILPIDEKVVEYFNEHFTPELKEGSDYEYTIDGNIIYYTSKVEKTMESLSNGLTEFLKDDILRVRYIETASSRAYEEDWDKYCEGGISKWEMDSICFYYHEHELIGLDTDLYDISDFNNLPEEPQAFETYWKGGREFRKFQLSRIAGTVLGRDKAKHTVSLLTKDGVVKVKLYQGSFTYYDKRISQYSEETGTNKVLDNSWFTRGTKLLVVGFRRDEQFVPRKYTGSIFQHTIMKITELNQDGTVELQLERKFYE